MKVINLMKSPYEGVRLVDEEWDVLIILDACRYDFFASTVGKYFVGKLEKRYSLGSCTPEWLVNNFTGYYPDIVYVSGNPYVNSKIKVGDFNAGEHFYHLINVWDFGWDRKLGTVHPQRIYENVLLTLKKFSKKRLIVHFMQPHAPYITKDYFIKGFPDPFTKGPIGGIQGNDNKKNEIFEKAFKYLGALLLKLNVIKNTWELRETLGLPPESPMDAVRRAYGLDGLKRAYQENLDAVLLHVSKLSSVILNKSSGRIVITADHGEFLGEDGRYAHPCKRSNSLLLEVPWFEIESVKKVYQEQVIDTDRENVKQKIKRLKDSGTI